MNNSIDNGVKLFDLKKYHESLEIFQNLLKNDPRNIKVLMYTSFNLMFLKKFEDAIKILHQVLKLKSNIADVNFNIALCYQNLNDYENAVENYKSAIKKNPNYHQAYINLGILFKNLERFEDSIEIYKKALNNKVNYEEIYINLSEVYKILKNYFLAKQSAESALKINNQSILALNNLGIAYIDEGDQKEAIKILENSKKINPNYFMTHSNLGIAYRYTGEYEKAKEAYKNSISLNPDYHDAYFNLGQIQLSEGDFENGWQNYEHRWGKLQKRPVRLDFNKPIWNPTLGYKRLLIWGEQGIGEQILFSTILIDLINLFEEILILIDDRLCPLYQSSFPKIKVLKKSENTDESLFDYHIPICSLGLFFRKNIGDFKSPEKVFDINVKKHNGKKRRCAISWISTNSDTGYSKSMTLEDLLPILQLDDIEFFNIQYTNEDNLVKEFCKKNGVFIHKIENLDTFNDLEGLINFISECDFTITVSNTNAHLSASIGQTTYLLLPKEVGKFWYWENELSNKNLWYPSIKKISQTTKQNWSDPIKKLEKILNPKKEILS